MKLAYSADGADTHVQADASGLLVNLGANNDVTVASGTVTVGGTATVTAVGTASVSIAGGSADVLATLQTGTSMAGYVGISTDGTAIADMLSLTNGTAVAVGVLDTDGNQVAFADIKTTTFTIAETTSAYAANDTMGTANTHTGMSRGDGYTGQIISAVCQDENAQGGTVYLWVFDSSVTPSADNSGFTLLSSSDLAKSQGVIEFSDWYAAGTAGYVGIGKLTPSGIPLHYTTSGGSALYTVAVSGGTGTYGGTSVAFELHAALD